jgi:hypothetical protein
MGKPVDLFLDDRQLTAIGEFSAYWTYLETEIDFTITAMKVQLDDSQKIPFPFSDRMKEWRKLIKRYPLTPHAKIFYNGLIDLILKAQDRRSTFLHGRVVGDPRKRTRQICFEHHRHRNGQWHVQPVPIEPRKLRTMARVVGSAAAALISLNRRYLRVSPRLPNTYPAPPRDGTYRIRRESSNKTKRKIQPRSSPL